MRPTRTRLCFFSMTALALGFCFLIGPPRVAAQTKQKALQPTSSGSQQGVTDAQVDLEALGSFQSEMRGFIERYVADRSSLAQLYAVGPPTVSGEGRSPNRSPLLELSPRARSRMHEFYSRWLTLLGEIHFDALSHDGQIDYLLLKNHLAHELRDLDIRSKALDEQTPLVTFAQTIVDLDEARRRMEPIDPAKSAAVLDNLNKQVEATRKAVEAALRPEAKTEPKPGGISVKKSVAHRAAGTVVNLRSILKDWYGFYFAYDPVFTWWVSEPYKAADRSLETYAAFLREKVVGVSPGHEDTVVGDPIGREALLSELAYEMIPYTPEELIAIANTEFAWCEKEMVRASRDLGYGDDWHKAVEHVKTMYVEPGKQPELVRKLMFEAVDYVRERDLVTVPRLAVETLRMEMMSPERQLVNPFFTGGELIRVSYPTFSMSHEQKMMSMRGNNIPFSRATVFHEMIPGHHLQGYMSARYRPYRRLFYTPFWSEGYALYWELLFWDLNFPRSPEDRIGMLFWRMHRCARIIFSLSFHLGKMTGQECVDFLVNRVGHERENAAGEVRRSFDGSYAPLYQCAYLLGGLELRALRHELVDSGKMTNRAFHDAVFEENGIPIEMIRASLTNQKLSRDFSSNWKFYGPNPASGDAALSKP